MAFSTHEEVLTQDRMNSLFYSASISSSTQSSARAHLATASSRISQAQLPHILMMSPPAPKIDFDPGFESFREGLRGIMEQEGLQMQEPQPSTPRQMMLPIRNHPSKPINPPFTTPLPKYAADPTPGTYLFTTFDMFEIEEWVKDFCRARYHRVGCESWIWEWKCHFLEMLFRLCDEDVDDGGEVRVLVEEERLEMTFREVVLVVAEMWSRDGGR